MNLERQLENFKNHIATFTDYGNIKILDFKKPDSNEYRIRFLFEEDYCRLHISGDLGELIATNYNNMTFEKFSDFVNNTGYFKEKVNCCSRRLHYFDEELARKKLKEHIEAYGLLDYYDMYSFESDEEKLENLLDDILYNFSDTSGISQKGFEELSSLDKTAWEWAYDLGKKDTGILELYMLAFKLATEQLKNK